MFPISELQDLTIFEIAKYWSRESKATASELRACMIADWWRGLLLGPASSDRLRVLKGLYDRNQNTFETLVFEVTNDQIGNSSAQTQSEGIVDLRPHIPIPSADSETWTKDNCSIAFEALADRWADDISDPIRDGLSGMKLQYAPYSEWLDQRCFSRPTFWASGLRPWRHNASRAEIEARLDTYDADTGKRGTKSGFEAFAKLHLPLPSRTLVRDVYDSRHSSNRGRPKNSPAGK